MDVDEKRFADVALVEAAVYGSVDYGIWTSTGGSRGCPKCPDYLTAVANRHVKHPHDCAREIARGEGADEVKESMRCGDLRARLLGVLDDPRLDPLPDIR